MTTNFLSSQELSSYPSTHTVRLPFKSSRKLQLLKIRSSKINRETESQTEKELNPHPDGTESVVQPTHLTCMSPFSWRTPLTPFQPSFPLLASSETLNLKDKISTGLLLTRLDLGNVKFCFCFLSLLISLMPCTHWRGGGGLEGLFKVPTGGPLWCPGPVEPTTDVSHPLEFIQPLGRSPSLGGSKTDGTSVSVGYGKRTKGPSGGPERTSLRRLLVPLHPTPYHESPGPRSLFSDLLLVSFPEPFRQCLGLSSPLPFVTWK